MHTSINELDLSSDKRREAQRIKTVDRDDPYFRSISISRVIARDGVQESCDMILRSSQSFEKYIILADCDKLLFTSLCFYDKDEAIRYYSS